MCLTYTADYNWRAFARIRFLSTVSLLFPLTSVFIFSFPPSALLCFNSTEVHSWVFSVNFLFFRFYEVSANLFPDPVATLLT